MTFDHTVWFAGFHNIHRCESCPFRPTSFVLDGHTSDDLGLLRPSPRWAAALNASAIRFAAAMTWLSASRRCVAAQCTTMSRPASGTISTFR